MSTYDLTTIKLPNNDILDITDNAKLPLAGGTLTGRVITSKTLNQIVTGEGTAAQDKGSSASPRYFPAKWTFDTGLTVTDGDILTIKIPVAGHDYGVYMSIDNGTNYAPVVTNGTGRVTTHYPVNTYITLVYEASGSAASMYPVNGGNSRVTINNGVWRIINYYDSGNTVSYQNRLASTCTIAGSNKIFPYTFIMQNSDGRWESIVTSASTGTSKARNTHGFRLGHVLLMYANATYNENALVSGYGYIYSSYTNTLDHRYSFNTANNAASGTTANQPIYLVGSIGNDGLFYLDTTWWTQTLPSTEDGKLYIYLGNAYDYYRMIFNEANPVYWYKNGAIRQYIQDSATVAGHTVALDVPANAVFTDEKVKQSPTTTNANYEILFSGSADNTEHIENTRKTSTFKYNPSTKSIQIGNLASNTTLGSYSIAVGDSNTASANYTAAFGYNNTVSGQRGFAEGYNNTISGGWGGHVEGGGNTVTADGGHAEGSGNIVHGYYAHAEGNSNQALAKAQHVFGEYNIADSDLGYWRGTYVEIVGNGTADDARSNARTLDWSGNEWLAGGLTIGNTAIPSGAELSNTYSSITNNSIVLQNNYTTPTSVNRSQTMTILPTDITVAGESEISGSWIGGQTSLRGALSWISNNAVAKSGDTINGQLLINATSTPYLGQYVNINEGEIEATRAIYTNNIQASGDIDITTGSNLNFYPTDATSQDTGDIVFYYKNNDNTFTEKSRIYMANNPTNVNEASPYFRAKKADGTTLIDTKLLTRKCITTVNTSASKACSTSWAYTGMSYVVPAYSVSTVTVRATWTNSVPQAVGVSVSSSSGSGGNLVAINTKGANNDHLTTTATVVNNTSSNKTYYVWAQYNGNTNNTIQMMGFHIPYST